MSYLLEAARSYQISPGVLEGLRAMSEWDQARAWGWIVETGELTGTGSRHAGPARKGSSTSEGLRPSNRAAPQTTMA
jgi:hypothetical protein